MEQPSSLTDIKEAFRIGETTCTELVQNCLNKISENTACNAFAEVYAEEALEQAKAIEARIGNDQAGKLAGLVVGIKDNLCYKDHNSQAASQILEGFQSVYSATAIQRLVEADAIIIGRHNCDEFGMGSSTENSIYGPVLNPADNSRVAGGSSGGSAAAVAFGGCHAALGTDTGGSVRQPASFCGVIGLKPTYSRVSRHGLLAYASSFDTIGILAKDMHTAGVMLETIAGEDALDSTCSKEPVSPYQEFSEMKSDLRIGYIADALDHSSLAPEVRRTTKLQLNLLEDAGHEVEPLKFDLLEYVLPVYYVLTAAEASSNLSRYDGVKYGLRSENAQTPDELYEFTRAEGFGEEVQRRILTGTFALSASYYDSYFTKAQKVRKLIYQETRSLLKDFDFILTPTAPTTAFKLKEHKADPLAMYLSDLLTVQASVTGVPAISVPIGTDGNHLPVGLQIMTDNFREKDLLSFADYIMTLNLTK